MNIDGQPYGPWSRVEEGAHPVGDNKYFERSKIEMKISQRGLNPESVFL
jgi:hypothetical protein